MWKVKENITTINPIPPCSIGIVTIQGSVSATLVSSSAILYN